MNRLGKILLQMVSRKYYQPQVKYYGNNKLIFLQFSSDEARKTQYTFRRRTSPSTITSSPNYDSSASLPPAKPPSSTAATNSSSSTASSYRARSSTREEPQRQNKSEVDFLLQVKSSPKVTTRSSSSSRVSAYRKSDEFDSDDEGSVQTSTTDTTLVNHEKELQVLRDKLNKAENMCDRLAEANEEMKKEIRDMEEEMDEMQDKFREDRADEYTSLKKELEQQTKNCRILSFKLRKAEKKAETLDAEKLEAERKCREVSNIPVLNNSSRPHLQHLKHSIIFEKKEETSKVDASVGTDRIQMADRGTWLEQHFSNRSVQTVQLIFKDASIEVHPKFEERGSQTILVSYIHLVNVRDPRSERRNLYRRSLPVNLEDMLRSISRSSNSDGIRQMGTSYWNCSLNDLRILTPLETLSLDGDQQTVDLKRQLQVIESEANVLRSKTQELEADNEKLVSENRRLTMLSSSRRSSSVERLGDSKTLNALEKQLDEANKRIETEKKKQEEVLKRLKEEAVETVTEYYKKRVPKKPTDLTTKLQMKKMVDDLENEIKQETAKDESKTLKKKIETLTIDLDNARKESESLKKQLDSAAQSSTENSKLIKEESGSAGDAETKKPLKPSAKSAQEIKELKEELAASKEKSKELAEKLEKGSTSRASVIAQALTCFTLTTTLQAEEELKKSESNFERRERKFTREIEEWEKKASELEMDLQDKMNEYDTLVLEKNRLQAFCDEKQSEIDQYKKETHGLKEQIDYMKKDNEELRRQIEDYEKVSKVHRSMNADVTALEKELKEYKTRLVMEEKAKKTELSKLKHRYDHRIAVLSDEMLSIQGQVARFKRERDSYRHMLEEAHRNIQEFKNTGTLSNRYSMDVSTQRIPMSSSIESDGGSVENVRRRTGVQRKNSTLRKSLSLEQTSPSEQVNRIVKLSGQSFCSQTGVTETLVRLSGGSTQSEVIPSSNKKKKLSLFGKLTKKLTKSRSIDNDGSEAGSTGRGESSNRPLTRKPPATAPVQRKVLNNDDIGTISPEISSIVQTTLLTALTGACYGGFMQSREGYLRFFENNQATQFTDHFEAKKKLQDTVTLNFAKGAMKWSWRLALFGCMYTTSVTVLATYRGDDSIFDFIAAGFLSGSLYRIKYGLRGVIVGGSLGTKSFECASNSAIVFPGISFELDHVLLLGLMIGLFAGSVTLAVLRLSDTKLDQIRKAQADLDHFRKK
ncbi:unnamed protein product [Nesidiocoris tenuis]|uniref:Uncharacterized protein n=1 Tax=Nesidiocoris tenuis TaxID=355587 RepID=A0A6H5HDB6_9HEMI|nr:unnamed protein product [Nesidiocoris tenuis]